MILFRFTIGARDPELCAFWEPHAPSPLERVKALRHAFAEGFNSSVSIEPMLDSVEETIKLVGKLEPFVTDTLWIGKMQRIPMKLNAHIAGFVAARELIRVRQTYTEILRLVSHLNQHPKVCWKDSIKAVISKDKEKAAHN